MIDVPKQMRTRPVVGGYVVPYFVAWVRDNEIVGEHTPNAKPDFRVVDQRKANVCRRHHMCWICGKKLGSFRWFVFGPSSAIARVSAEPPSHRECAHYAVQVCPYMLNANKQHRPVENPAEGTFLMEDVEEKNPGIIVLWATKHYELIPVDPSRGIMYYDPGDPDVVEFWREGRKATRAEIATAVNNVFINNPHVDRTDRNVAWRVEHMMRFAPPEEEAA